MFSGLPADGTMAAAVIYTIGDLHRPGCVIDYPKGGGGAVIGAMVRPLLAISRLAPTAVNCCTYWSP